MLRVSFVLSLLFSMCYTFSAEASVPAGGICVEEFLFCEDGYGFDWDTLECIDRCFYTHHCSEGPSSSYYLLERRNCALLVADARRIAADDEDLFYSILQGLIREEP